MLRDFSRLNNQHFDVLICGGGIYGAWTAYDAIQRGLKVAIIDQGDWANATSSASSKLIHGGLRYLESMDIRLVKKSLNERQMFLKAAPHRVWSLRFGIPVYKNSRLRSWQLHLGLGLYDFLAGLSKDHVYRSYSGNEFGKRFSCLEQTGLMHGFSYFDAQTDDARLVLELIAGAMEKGAVCVNYCQLTGFLEQSGRLYGARILDTVTNTSGIIYARQLVDTMGRWSDSCKTRVGTLSKGIHLVLPGILENEALLLTAKSDGRVFFIIPWYGVSLLGTTDSNYVGDLNHVSVNTDEICYLLSEANLVLKTVNWTYQDIIGSFAGLRVLKSGSDKSPSMISRDWLLRYSKNGLLSSVGGKISSAREDASCIVDAICKKLKLDATCQTFAKAFPWSPTGDYQQWERACMSKAEALKIDKESAGWLLRRHGFRVKEIFSMCVQQPVWVNRILPSLPFIEADLIFCAQNEMVVHLHDLIRRRLPLMILSRLTDDKLQEIANTVAPILSWDEDRIKNECASCYQETLEATN